MAKRSDFAQKLLDDLRLRKERMAAAQTTKTTNRPSTSGEHLLISHGAGIESDCYIWRRKPEDGAYERSVCGAFICS